MGKKKGGSSSNLAVVEIPHTHERKRDKNGVADFERLPQASSGGGWEYDNEEELKAQRGVMWDIAKSLGQSIMNSGKDLTRIAIPVRVFEPRSYLQRAPDGWGSAPVYLSKAAACDDPVERMKLVIVFLLSGLSVTCRVMAKPFNPILGETFEAYFDDGTTMFLEQTSHHPPITGWQVFGPNHSWKMYGYGEWTASFRGNAIRGLQTGPSFVEFPGKKGVIEFNLPEAWVRGMLFGTRLIEYDGRLTFADEENGLKTEIAFNPDGGGLLSGWWGKKRPSDYLKGDLVRGEDAEVVSSLYGTWLGGLEWDGECYWDISHANEAEIHFPAAALPSDSRVREDVQWLDKKDLDMAAEWKLKLEEKQRLERKWREEGAEVEVKAGRTVTKSEVLERQKRGLEPVAEGGKREKKEKKKKKKKEKAEEEEGTSKD